MKKIVLVGLFTCSSMMFSSEVEAQPKQYETSFRFNVTIGEVETAYSAPTPEGKRITLPSQFMNWNCGITHQYLSNDGKKVYHNIACKDTETPLVIGVTIQCSIASEDVSFQGLFLRANGVSVSFNGYCITALRRTKPATGGATL